MSGFCGVRRPRLTPKSFYCCQLWGVDSTIKYIIRLSSLVS